MYKIKVAFLMAYDYEMLKISIPLVYNEADAITLSVDINRKTYKGNRFEIPVSFFNWIKLIDTEKKIVIYEDDFAIEGYSPRQCEVRQRLLTSEFMGKGGWHIQIDADEYFISFFNFVKQLHRFEKRLKNNQPVTVYANWLTIFKQVKGGYLIPVSSFGNELCHIATNFPSYEFGRNSSITKYLNSDNFILHDSWARDPDQLYIKLKNWSHSDDFDADKFFVFWKLLNEENYKEVKNFHPLYPATWQKLEFLKGNNISDLINFTRVNYEDKIKQWKTILRNIKGGGRLLKFIEKFIAK